MTYTPRQIRIADPPDSLPVEAATINAEFRSIAAALNDRAEFIQLTLDGSGDDIDSGWTKAQYCALFAGRITEIRLLSGQDLPGNIEIDICKVDWAHHPPDLNNSICHGNYPALASATKYLDRNLDDYDLDVAVGDVFRFYVRSCSEMNNVTMTIKISH